MSQSIPGYAYGSPSLARSPISMDQFQNLKAATLFGDDDVKALRMSYEVLKDQTEAVLDVWYGFVGATPALLHFFTKKSDAQPNGDYLGAVRKRFGQWILDTAAANFDQKWLDWQYEIGLRHHRVKKNKTDNVDSVDHIALRYIIALTYPITATLKPFLAKKGHSAEDVEKMHAAWTKAVLLTVALWSQPYVKEGDF